MPAVNVLQLVRRPAQDLHFWRVMMSGRQETAIVILLTVPLVLLLLDGNGGYCYGRGARWGGPQYGGGMLGLSVLLLVLLWLTGNIGGPAMR